MLSYSVWIYPKDGNAAAICIGLLTNILNEKSKSKNESDDAENQSENEACLLSSMLSLTSPAIPLLATLLQSSDNTLREKVLKIFMSLVEIFSPIPGYRVFLEQIVADAEELKLDPE